MLSEADSNKFLHILIAEDNVCDLELMLRMLKHMGHSADSVTNGLEVIHALQNKCYNVILMDIEMPVMNGLDATRIIRHRWRDRRIKIIAVTGRNQKDDKQICIEAGMDDHIAKPVVMDALNFALNHCLSMNRDGGFNACSIKIDGL